MSIDDIIKFINENCRECNEFDREWYENCEQCGFLKKFLEKPQGEWYYNYQNGWHCSICNESVKDMPTAMGIATFKFCPNCGAKMKDNTKQ